MTGLCTGLIRSPFGLDLRVDGSPSSPFESTFARIKGEMLQRHLADVRQAILELGGCEFRNVVTSYVEEDDSVIRSGEWRSVLSYDIPS